MDLKELISHCKSRQASIDTLMATGHEHAARTQLQLMAADIANALRQPEPDPDATEPQVPGTQLPTRP